MTTPNDRSVERAAFELYFSAAWLRRDGDTYKDVHADLWEGWKARCEYEDSRATLERAEVGSVVPGSPSVDLTERAAGAVLRPVITELGCAGHFIAARNCSWRRHTQVGSYRISSVGEYRPDENSPRQTIGAGDDAFFETYVFRTSDEPAEDNEGCGCRAVLSFSEIDGERYATAGEAQAGHERYVGKYAAIAASWNDAEARSDQPKESGESGSTQAGREPLTDEQILKHADNLSGHCEPGEWWDFERGTLLAFARALAPSSTSPETKA